MASLKLHPNKSITGIDFIDERSGLYYGRYQYRARLTLTGLNRTYSTHTFLDYLKVIERVKRSSKSKTARMTALQQEIADIDLDSIDRFITWRNTNAKSKGKQAMIRVESNTAAIFSNDMDLLRTIEKIGPQISKIDYTEVDQAIPQGTKYYVEQPPHNYRVYLKSKAIDPKVKADLLKFINRYKGTGTVIVPSGAFSRWLEPPAKTLNSSYNTYWASWNTNYLSSHYFLDFDEESTDTLFSIMFGELISRRYKLEKRPTVV